MEWESWGCLEIGRCLGQTGSEGRLFGWVGEGEGSGVMWQRGRGRVRGTSRNLRKEFISLCALVLSRVNWLTFGANRSSCRTDHVESFIPKMPLSG